MIKTTEYTKAKKPLSINKSDKKYKPYKKIIGIKKFTKLLIIWSSFILKIRIKLKQKNPDILLEYRGFNKVYYFNIMSLHQHGM